MKRLSSKQTFFSKRIFPALWLGGVALICGFAVVVQLAKQDYLAAILTACAMAAMLALGYVLFRFHFRMFHYVDEVWDCKTHLLIKNDGVVEKVPYEECLEANWTRTPRCTTVTFKRSTKLGTEIVFLPSFSMIPFAKPPAVRELLARIEAAKKKLPAKTDTV